jgi:hypothetical protein
MPSIITATELRSVLGVSSALYDDTYLEGIIDTAENTILPMLVTFKSSIQKTVINKIMLLHLLHLAHMNLPKVNQ